LNTNFLSFIRSFTNRGEKDVFKSTQDRLTRIYSGLLMLFLVLFIFIVYSVLYVVILKNQERELQSFVNQEAGLIENYLMKNEQSDLQGMGNQEVVFAGVNQFFYYVVNPNGEIIMGAEADRRLRPNILGLVRGRFQHDRAIQKETLHVRGNPNGRGNKGEFRPPEAAQDIRLMIASQAIYNKGQFMGQLYIGKDISFAYQLFHSLFMILVAIGTVFFGVALYISIVMSKRAMIPNLQDNVNL
jgi:hypothetical protein